MHCAAELNSGRAGCPITSLFAGTGEECNLAGDFPVFPVFEYRYDL
jgi:hypothetical protein